MKDFASKLGVPRKKIIVEDRSRDTIGNAYFSRLLLGSKRWGRIVAVTSDYHVKRARFIFGKVYGKGRVRFISANAHYPKPKMAKARIAENYSLKLAKDFFKGVRDSDIKAIRHLIYTQHRVYSKNPRIGDAKIKELDKLERLRSMQYRA
jgi:3'-phosphoadenosine 5'-phosphosulfate sulfotransferase